MARRIQTGLYQQQAAKQLGVTINTVIDWEKNRVEPEIRHWPKIIAFLGYDPHPEPHALGERLRAKYRELGLPRTEVARRLGMDENSLRKYEGGHSEPTIIRTRRLIEELLGDSPRTRVALDKRTVRFAKKSGS